MYELTPFLSYLLHCSLWAKFFHSTSFWVASSWWCRWGQKSNWILELVGGSGIGIGTCWGSGITVTSSAPILFAVVAMIRDAKCRFSTEIFHRVGSSRQVVGYHFLQKHPPPPIQLIQQPDKCPGKVEQIQLHEISFDPDADAPARLQCSVASWCFTAISFFLLMFVLRRREIWLCFGFSLR